MKFGIVVFPGSNCDSDCFHAVELMGHEPKYLWYANTDLEGVDCIVLPGGFSYGDYLRSGAMASAAPIMSKVKEFANNGGLVIGICNGFQILQEAGLLPGAMLKNKSLKFICKDVFIKVERDDTPFTSACKVGDVLRIPIAHMDGNFFADDSTGNAIKRGEQVLFRYCNEEGDVTDDYNPNGAWKNTAGVINKEGNVCGLMPHPERSMENLLGCENGRKIFQSIIKWWEEKSKL